MTTRDAGAPTATAPRGLGHLPALDGLRALSLAAVLLYHSGFGWARGGYLGVTVFFTLSGFLITSLMLQERDHDGTIRLRQFWQRRAQRLVPGVLGLLVLVVAFLALAGGHRPQGVVGDAVATATWVANWRFIASGETYAGLFGDPSPFQHMWSLAVEEQLYLLLPGLVLLLVGRRGAARRRRLGVALAMGVTLSTVACAALVHGGDTTRSYFGTDTRIAEPLVGALLALALLRGGALRELSRSARRLLDVLAVVAATGLVLLVHGLGEYDPRLYRGGFLLTAGLSAVLVAAATQRRGLLARALSLPALTDLGRISYGGYLYHWPLFLWIDTERTGLTGFPLLSARLLATLTLATASYWLLESPVRRQRSLQVGAALIGWAGASVALVAAIVVAAAAVPALSVAGDAAAGPPPLPRLADAAARPAQPVSRVRLRQPAIRAAALSPTGTPAPERARPSSTKGPDPFRFSSTPAKATPPAVAGSGVAPLRIAVVGDSMGADLGDGLVAWAKKRTDVVVYNLAIPSCPIGPGGTRRFPDGYTAAVSPACAWWQDPNDQRSVDLASFKPDVIVMQDSLNEMVDRKLDTWPTYQRPGDPLYDQWMLNEYNQAFTAMNPKGTATFLLLDAACGNWDQVSHFQGSASDYQGRVATMNNLYGGMTESSTLHRASLDGNLCPGGQFTSTVDGVNDARPDGYHLSTSAELAVATSWLGPLAMKAGAAS